MIMKKAGSRVEIGKLCNTRAFTLGCIYVVHDTLPSIVSVHSLTHFYSCAQQIQTDLRKETDKIRIATIKKLYLLCNLNFECAHAVFLLFLRHWLLYEEIGSSSDLFNVCNCFMELQ